MQKPTTVQVRVKPNAKQVKVIEEEEGNLVISLKSPPVDGKANAELIEVLADWFGVSKKSVRIKLGLSSKRKLVEIDV